MTKMQDSTTISQKRTNIIPSVKECEVPIKGYCVSHKMRNTLIALSLASTLHAKQTRKGGAPYIIHPLMMTKYLIDLEISEQLENWPSYDEKRIHLFFDTLCAACMLHDVIEDCIPDKERAKKLFDEYHLDPEVYDLVLILTKDKEAFKANKEEANEIYYKRIVENAAAILIKICDRTNNCSTMDAFTKEKMIEYVYETIERVYPLCEEIRKYNPEFSHCVTIMKYLLTSICETIASMLDLKDVINVDPERYKKTFDFIRYYAKGKMNNTLVALGLARKYHMEQSRNSGDPFIIHPLRVCSYLINLKITDDEACAAALLHEITKKCDLPEKWEDKFKSYGISARVIELIHTVSNDKNLPKEVYYENLRNDPLAFLIKLSNRAHTCTKLSQFTDKQIEEYIAESNEFLYPICDELSMLYPQYTDAIIIARYHIQAVSNMVIRLQEIKMEELKKTG